MLERGFPVAVRCCCSRAFLTAFYMVRVRVRDLLRRTAAHARAGRHHAPRGAAPSWRCPVGPGAAVRGIGVPLLRSAPGSAGVRRRWRWRRPSRRRRRARRHRSLAWPRVRGAASIGRRARAGSRPMRQRRSGASGSTTSSRESTRWLDARASRSSWRLGRPLHRRRLVNVLGRLDPCVRGRAAPPPDRARAGLRSGSPLGVVAVMSWRAEACVKPAAHLLRPHAGRLSWRPSSCSCAAPGRMLGRLLGARLGGARLARARDLPLAAYDRDAAGFQFSEELSAGAAARHPLPARRRRQEPRCWCC